MKPKLKTVSVSALIAQDELAEGQRLNAEYDRLVRQALSLGHIGLVNSLRAARHAYTADPSEANFTALQNAEIGRAFFALHNVSRQAAREAAQALLDNAISAWELPIVTRVLDAARGLLEEVRTAEAARTKELTGRDDLSSSALLDFAATPVRRLEGMLATVEKKGFGSGILPPTGFVSFLTQSADPFNKTPQVPRPAFEEEEVPGALKHGTSRTLNDWSEDELRAEARKRKLPIAGHPGATHADLVCHLQQDTLMRRIADKHPEQVMAENLTIQE